MAVKSLGRLRAPESIEALAQAAMAPGAVHRNAMAALAEVLPLISEAHFGQLDDGTVPAMCRALRIRNPQLRIALVKALRKVGDGRAIWLLQDLLRGADESLAAAIQESLPILHERERLARDSRTLLRAAQPAERDSLLRPAGVPDSTTNCLLLHPADEQGSLTTLHGAVGQTEEH